jgi:hypothetical protein
MKKLMFVMAVAIFMIPALGMMSPVYAQFDGDVDLSSILNGGGERGGNRGNNNRGPQIPDGKIMFDEIQATLKKGKTPMEDAQKKPIQNLLNMEIVTLTDKIQLLRNNNNNNNPNFNNQAQPDQGRGGRGGGNNQPQNPQQSDQAIKIDTITSLKNDDFLATKLPLFLSPEQTALVQKTRAEDKSNSTCLGGLLDRYYQQLNSNNNRGNQNQNYNNNNNNNNNNNQNRPNGQKYCMTTQATPSERLEPIRKVLAKGNLPLAKDKDMIAEVFMKAELQDLETALRAGLTNNNNQGGRGNNNNNNRNNNPQQMIQSSIDGMYKKVEELLKPDQAAVLKTWHYTQMLGRTPIDSLIAVNAMQDTPLSDEQIAKVTAAWPEYRNQIQQAARAAGKNVDAKTIDSAAMNKILDMLEPSQVASYQLAKKYGAEAVAK